MPIDYQVVCHHRDHDGNHESAKHPRSQSRMIGSPDFGGLWHCPAHEDCTSCPHGSWTEPKAAERAKGPQTPTRLVVR